MEKEGTPPSERVARLEVMVERHIKQVDKLLNALDGPSGILVRLDRVEQTIKGMKVYSHAVAVAVIAAFTGKYLPMIFK